MHLCFYFGKQRNEITSANIQKKSVTKRRRMKKNTKTQLPYNIYVTGLCFCLFE